MKGGCPQHKLSNMKGNPALGSLKPNETGEAGGGEEKEKLLSINTDADIWQTCSLLST